MRESLRGRIPIDAGQKSHSRKFAATGCPSHSDFREAGFGGSLAQPLRRHADFSAKWIVSGLLTTHGES